MKLAQIDGVVCAPRMWRRRKRIGWSSDFRVSRLAAWAERRGFTVAETAPLFPAGFFKLMRLRKPE